MHRSYGQTYLVLACALALQACGSEENDQQTEQFSLRFAAVVDGSEVGCTDELEGFGPAQGDRVGLNDLRFYVSNVRFKDAEGNDVELTLDTNEFQYASPEGSVALIDLTGNTEGSCSSTSVAYAEGTARTNQAIAGTTVVERVASVSFDVGVPQAVMRATIATNTPEGAPSPLNEMYWNWNSGYRHFVFNFSVRDSTDVTGAGYVHVGSRDCAPDGDANALSDRDRCTFVNTPAVSLSSFDLTTNSVGIDLRKVVEGLDFRSPIYDPTTFEVIGEGPGVECHSSPTNPHCAPIFGKFGLDMATGEANAATDTVFVRM
jgi:uncharacterized repeat protein (TIGR04052 family)